MTTTTRELVRDGVPGREAMAPSQPVMPSDGRVRQVEGVKSTLAIAGHPIHPMLVPFPIALLSSALATDLAYAATKRPFWAMSSLWLTRAGAVSALVAGVVGATDFLTIGKARSKPDGWIHGGGNLMALSLALVSHRLRSRDVAGAVVPGGLTLSALIAGILTVTGWFGGELAYRYGIGVVGEKRES